MANNKVKFLRGTSNEYTAAEKDNDTIYFTTDDGKLYIGDKEVSGSDVTIDSKLSNTSENPVQNKVVTTELNKKANKEIYGDSGISLGRDPDTNFGHNSIAIGDYCTATRINSIAIGNQATATGNYAISIGNFTTASGEKSVAMNNSTIAEGANSFAGGLESKTMGNNSFAFGSNVVTNKNNSAAFGAYNKSDENTLFSIGNGDSDTERSNAFEITKTGGKLYNKNIITIDDVATQSANGLMSAADKKKLDEMAAVSMPMQKGTIALTTGTVQGVQLTFPTPFKSAPLLLLSIEDDGNESYRRTESIAFDNLSKTGANIRTWYTNNDYRHDLPCTVHWAAFGEIEV